MIQYNQSRNSGKCERMSIEGTYSDLSLHNDGEVSKRHCSNPPIKHNVDSNELGVRLVWRRWLVLAIFSLFIILNVFNLTEYFDVEDAFLQFYVSVV